MNGLALFVDLTLKVTVVLLAAHAVHATLGRRGSAALRHFGWVLALGACLLLPALSAIAPAWRLPLLPTVDAPAASDASPVAAAVPAPKTDGGAGAEEPLRRSPRGRSCCPRAPAPGPRTACGTC